MQRLIKKRSKKAGLPPGSLVHIGDKAAGKVKLSMITYGDKSVQVKELTEINECILFREKPAVTWINLEGVHDVEMIERLGECYGFHTLILEDILTTDQRPKVEDMDEYIYLVLKMLRLSDNNEVVPEQVSIIFGESFVISFQEAKTGDIFRPVRERLINDKGRIRLMGADYLAYALMDLVVDNYFSIMEKLGERIEALESELIASPSPDTLSSLYHLKREMLVLRKSVWPLRDLLSTLLKRDSPLITEPVGMYLKDVYDHTIQVLDLIETFREMLSGMLDIYLTSASNRLNEVMKVLTIIATIFMPLTFIAGIYGMNFHFMPELQWKWGYPLALLLMLIIGGAMLLFFRRKRWL